MKMDHRRPSVSFTYGTIGKAHMAPRLYADEIIPRSAPLGWWKSALMSCDFQPDVQGPTSLPRRRNLHCVDHLRVEARCHFNANAGRQQQHVQSPQIAFPIPWHSILFDDARENGFGQSRSSGGANGHHFIFDIPGCIGRGSRCAYFSSVLWG
jgi:hypothetical protein